MRSPRRYSSVQCSPFHVNTPLAPEIERLKRATGIQETDDPKSSLAKLRSLLARAGHDVEQALRYYGALLSIPACSGYEPADLGSPSSAGVPSRCSSSVLVAASRKEADPVHRRGRPVDRSDEHRTSLSRDRSLPGERIMYLITHRDDYRPTGCRAGQFEALRCKSWRGRMRADGGRHCRHRYRVAPDHKPDCGKNRRRAAVHRGVYARGG